MTRSHTLIVVTLGMFLFVSCSNNNKESENASEVHDTAEVAAQDTTPVTVNDTTKFKFDFTIANIPSPAGALQDLASWGVPYDNSILNDTKNAQKYVTEFQRSINLAFITLIWPMQW